jgi:cardiolipin synthase
VLAEQAFSRTAGAPLTPGNSVRLLKDARENYPAWLDAILAAQSSIHFECYIIHDDEVGREFAEALCTKAREGVRIRLIYDWLGGLPHTSRRFWNKLRQAGVEVRCFNPPRFDQPFGWLSRNHRKLLTVDARVGFVTGLCVGRHWVGQPEKHIEPWRDTGVEIRGPALAELDAAFGHTWGACGAPLPAADLPDRSDIPIAGEIALRVIGSMPNTAGLYRLDQLIAAAARETLWLTDAYFVGTTPYVQALGAAARDNVDVRLLVPGATDLPLMRAVSRAGYRPLLESGVRIFEWNGPMLHAKCAVADGRWARVGSTNLNLASWIGNWEVDVAIEDEGFAQQMEDMYLDDLTHATEIVLTSDSKIRPMRPRPRMRSRRRRGSAGRVAAGAIQIEHAVHAAIANRRPLGPAEATVMAGASLLLMVFAAAALFVPRAITVPLAVVALWVSLSLLVRAHSLRKERKRK